MKVDDVFHGISTLVISVMPDGQNQGTGFFYQQLAPKDPTKEGQWRAIEKTWLVTNRHVVLPKIGAEEKIPETLSFHLRKIQGEHIIWDPIILQKTEFLERAKFHEDPDVDVCIIEILDLLTEKIKTGDKYLQWYGVSKENLPGENKIFPEVSSDTIVIGYPRGFYDEFNLYPICKSGVIASRWGAKFNGKPYFLIDAKLFPGSSGSIVISKPIDFLIQEGKLLHSKEKQFAFLGVFSGEPVEQRPPVELEDIIIIRKSSFNLGIVWYSYLIEEIIKSGKKCSGT